MHFLENAGFIYILDLEAPRSLKINFHYSHIAIKWNCYALCYRSSERGSWQVSNRGIRQPLIETEKSVLPYTVAIDS